MSGLHASLGCTRDTHTHTRSRLPLCRWKLSPKQKEEILQENMSASHRFSQVGQFLLPRRGGQMLSGGRAQVARFSLWSPEVPESESSPGFLVAPVPDSRRLCERRGAEV